MSAESVEHLKSRMDGTWPEFRSLVESVPAEEMEAPGVVDEWCMKELLGHVSFWAQKGARDVRAATAGKIQEIEVPQGKPMVDEWNATAAARGKAMSAEALVRELERSHEDARNALEDATDEAVAIEIEGWTVGVRFAEDTYRHYREHGQQIRAWQKQMETSEV